MVRTPNSIRITSKILFRIGLLILAFALTYFMVGLPKPFLVEYGEQVVATSFVVYICSFLKDT